MSAREFVEWQAYYALEPFGAERDAAHAGVIASAIGNFSGLRKSQTALKPSDFMVQYDAVREDEMSAEDQAALQQRRERELYEGLHALAIQSAGKRAR